MTADSITSRVLEPLARGARRFENKVCVIAGAGQGIGSKTARRLAQEGAAVVIGDWVEETARRVERDILDFGEQASVHVGNYLTWEGCQSLIDFSKQTYGRIDSLIIMAGGTAFGNPFQFISPEQIEADVTKKFWPTMWCARAVLPVMIEQHKQSVDGVGGNIVTIATHALVGLNRVPYAASAGGIIGLTVSLCKEVGRYGIRVNCVAPSLNTADDKVTPSNKGFEHIERTVIPAEERISQPVDEQGNRTERPLAVGLGRSALVQEVAAAVAFMASDDAGFISGQVISVGGGETFPF